MKIGLLNAYACTSDAADFRQGYGAMFQRFFTEHFPSDFSLHEYNVAQRYWPNALHECDGWIIGASQQGIHDKNSWITKLMEFACACHFNQRPLIGIGFGHQVIAYALGGDVNRSPKGWGAGLRGCNIRVQKPWMRPALACCSLNFSHQEQVTMLPGEATLLAGDSLCLYQMYAIGEHIFAIQGHPEYDRSFMQRWLDENRENLTEECYEQALASLDRPMDSDAVGSWMWRFFAYQNGAEIPPDPNGAK